MIKNLILGSGAVHGYSFIGSLKYLHEKKYLDNLENILGTSVGSIFGFVYSLGFSISEIEELGLKLIPDMFLDINFKSFLKFFEEFGLDDGDKIIKIIKIMSKRKLGNSEITFKELYEYSGIKFIVPATNINKKKIIYFSYENYPDLEVYKAIRMSISIPILFKPFKFENDLFVDGGVLDPCSVDYFKNEKETLCLMISGRKDHNEIDNFKDFFVNVYCCPIEKVRENSYDKPNIIIFSYQSCNSLNFEIETATIQDLVKYGYDITQEELPDIIDYFKKK